MCVCVLQRALSPTAEREERESCAVNNAPYIRLGGPGENNQTHDIRTSEHLSWEEREVLRELGQTIRAKYGLLNQVEEGGQV